MIPWYSKKYEIGESILSSHFRLFRFIGLAYFINDLYSFCFSIGNPINFIFNLVVQKRIGSFMSARLEQSVEDAD